MIYQLHVFALLIFMPRFNTINFYQNKPKIKLFLPKKMQNFRALAAPPPHLRNNTTAPLLQISGYAPDQ